MKAPSGTQSELALGDQRAVVVEVGGGLRTYSSGGRAVLDGYAEDELCGSGRGQLLLPWPNRIADGRYEFDGEAEQLPLDEPERGNAIHGLVRWATWRVAARAPDSVTLEHLLHPRPGYPFALELRVRYSLDADGLSVSIEATNIGTSPCPYGAGAHPYLALDSGIVDGVTLQVPAETVLEADERGIPVSTGSVDGTHFDFRAPRKIGSLALDHCFTDLVRGEDGRARVQLGNEATLWADESFGYLMVFTGDGLPDVARRSLAVEPMTCAPNAFRTGDGLIRLEPGETHTAVWGITPARTR
ncbi:MAG TPA: aldose 1-epimerase family protein [Gaiellaceae bacterium]